MSSLKNVLVITVLLGVGYAVYTTINSQPVPTRPTEQADGWPPPVDVQMPGVSDAKSSAAKNPFAARDDQAAARVPARDADPFGSRRPDPSTAATARSASAPNDRASPPFSAKEDKAVLPPRDAAGRAANPMRPSDRFAAEVPGVATSTDLPPNPQTGLGASEPSQARPEIPGAAQDGVRKNFIEMMDEAQRLLANGQLAEVHLALSKLYGNSELTADESQRLTELLDQLTGTVIYSRQHLLEPPYVVKLDDSLQKIAQAYNVPWRLLAKINGIQDPDRLRPGDQLKVVRGPFEAVVFLGRYELVLMLGDRYAGRFPIGIGRDNPQLEGSFSLQKKVIDPPYLGPDRSFEPGDPNNPLGKFWLELGDRIALHGTNDMQNLRRADGRGTICLGPRDIEDLFDILTARAESTLASKVTIRR